jgi:hypothetical protein
MALQRARGDPLARLVFLICVRSTQTYEGGRCGRNGPQRWGPEAAKRLERGGAFLPYWRAVAV